jgi:hypothetical protein
VLLPPLVGEGWDGGEKLGRSAPLRHTPTPPSPAKGEGTHCMTRAIMGWQSTWGELQRARSLADRDFRGRRVGIGAGRP